MYENTRSIIVYLFTYIDQERDEAGLWDESQRKTSHRSGGPCLALRENITQVKRSFRYGLNQTGNRGSAGGRVGGGP